MKKIILLFAISLRLAISHPTTIQPETDSDKSRKIIGQSVVTSVSVIMNGNEEPQFTDAVGKTVPRPFVPPQVASPINLLNPDRYEFYTFNEKGELIKRLMTLKEIQSIVANGNGALISSGGGDNDPNESQSVILNTIPLTNTNHDSDTKVQDIVDNVQNVLSREMENNKNLSNIPHELLDTPNVSSSWSMILPAIFGNTGDEILPQIPINMTPETEVIDTTTSTTSTATTTTKRSTSSKRPATKKPSVTTTRKAPTTTKLVAKQTTKSEQKRTTTPASTINKTQTKKPATSSTTKKQQQTIKSKPTNSLFRSTTRRPIVPIIDELPSSIKESNEMDETTKTVFITSRPYSTAATTESTTTRSSIIKSTTTKKIVKKPTVSNAKRNSTSSLIIQKIPASSLIKDSQITMIEVKPMLVESKTEESKIEKVTHAPSTILSTMSSTSSQMPTIITESVKVETFPPTTKMTSTKSPSTIMTSMESKIPSTVFYTTVSNPITFSTEKQTTSTTMHLSPIKLETTEKSKAPETTSMSMMDEEMTTIDTPSSEEIRQDLAISQIIGSLQNDNHYGLNPLFKPFNDENKVQMASSPVSISRIDETTTTKLQMVEKNSENLDHVPDKMFTDNQLYLEEKDPMVKEIPTTMAPLITTMESDTVFEKISSSTTKSKEDSILLIENSEVMQTIEKLLEEQNKSKTKVNPEKLDILGFDDDDDTEIKFGDALNADKKNYTKIEHITKRPSTTSTTILERRTTTAKPQTTTPSYEENDTTISTILSEALTNVIEQMMKEQESRKTSTTTTEKAISKKESSTTESSAATTTTSPEVIEPSLDELNKLLHHYQELSSKHDELESLSQLKEDLITTTEITAPETSTVYLNKMSIIKTNSQPIIEEKSSMSLQNDKIYSEIDSTTAAIPLDDEKTTTEDPTAQEFTTFFYVSDGSVEETTDLGAFTTEQFVTSEKKISDRKNEALSTTNPPLTDSDENNDNSEEEEVETPGDLVSNVLDAIGLSSNSEEDDDENSSTEKNLKTTVAYESNPIESDESDEVMKVITKFSSTLDKTIKTDLKTDIKLTSNIANSLMSVADTLSETLNGDTESDESTDIFLRTTVIPKEDLLTSSTSTQKAITDDNKNYEEIKQISLGEKKQSIELSSEASQDTTTEFQQLDENTTENLNDSQTTLVVATENETKNKKPSKKSPKPAIDKTNNDSSPLIQLSIIRKEDSLEEINIMTPAVPTSTIIPISEGNFIKIESIDVSTSLPSLNETKTKKYESNKPTFVVHRPTTTAKSSSLPEIVPSQATSSNDTVDADKTDEPFTERVPLIEKAASMTSTPIMMASDENLVQIQVQTKSPPTVSTISSSTAVKTTIESKQAHSSLVNAQSIKNSIKNSQQNLLNTRPIAHTIDLSSSPSGESLGLAASTASLSSDLSDFSKLCNELAFTFWKSITADGISQSRSVVISPFALTSTLSMIFLGARGQTSGEMNDLLRLDETVTFNPHVVFRNISESVEQSRNSGIAAAAFARELYSDRTKGKILPYFKEKAQQFYGAHVEEVNFNVINDILRRRTNLLVKRHTYNKIKEYLKTNNIWVNEPLAAISANIFMTDCSGTQNNERDGEMFFQVSPAVRQRRLVPIPAVVFRRGFTAGYDPILDATAVAFGDDLQSTILVMPGQQGSLLPGDNLERLETAFLDSSNDVWGRLLKTFMERPGLEVQIPRFSHRSLINTTFALQQMGLKDIFDSEKADLRGLTGVSSSDLHFSDLIQINQFTTCGEDKIGDSHHIEIYPAPALKREYENEEDQAKFEMASIDGTMQYKSLFYDPIYDSRYINVPLPLRPRQARLPENPRLRFDRPFLYFVRHNPTGIILFMGRFNPRLLP